MTFGPSAVDDRTGAFAPPGPGVLETYLKAHPPAPEPLFQRWTPLLVLIGLLVVAVTLAHPLAALLPWVGLAGMLGYFAWRGVMQQRLAARVQRVQDLTALRYYPQALRVAWRVLPDAARQPELYMRTLGLMAMGLESVKAYDSALVACDVLVDHLPEDHPAAIHFGLIAAISQLATDRLTDGDEKLRRLRGSVENYPNSPVSAVYRTAVMLQQVRTHHARDLADAADDLIPTLRPLGAEAAYGYAFAAWAHCALADRAEQQARSREDGAPAAATEVNHALPNDDASSDSDSSTPSWTSQARDELASGQLWWDRATRLMKPQALVDRYPVLESVGARLQAAPRPEGV